MDDSDPIHRAIKAAGSEEKLGKLAGYSQVAINKAKRRGRVSGEMAVAIERGLAALDGVKDRVTAAELRPDLFQPASA